MIFSTLIQDEPERQPDEAKSAGKYEGGLPAVFLREPGHEQNGSHRAYICAGIEDARGDASLSLGKPLGDGLDTGGKVRSLTKTKEDTRYAKRERCCRGCMRHGGGAPHRHR